MIRSRRELALACGSKHATWFNVIMQTLEDYVFRKVITEGRSFLVYEIVKKRQYGVRCALVVAIYVPPELRGKGIATKMIDKIKEKVVINAKGNREVGRLYVCREDIY